MSHLVDKLKENFLLSNLQSFLVGSLERSTLQREKFLIISHENIFNKERRHRRFSCHDNNSFRSCSHFETVIKYIGYRCRMNFQGNLVQFAAGSQANVDNVVNNISVAVGNDNNNNNTTNQGSASKPRPPQNDKLPIQL